MSQLGDKKQVPNLLFVYRNYVFTYLTVEIVKARRSSTVERELILSISGIASGRGLPSATNSSS